MHAFVSLATCARRLPPPALAFLASLALSAIAIAGTLVIGKDAAYYLDLARQALEHGPSAARQIESWPWFPLLIAGSHRLSGLPLEALAYLWCSLFAAGTCAVLVAATQERIAGSGYWACLIVLAMPAFNQFRDDIIREHGYWFFVALALWLALRWLERGGWARAAVIHLALAGAVFFRLEAVFLVPALVLGLCSELRTRQGWLRLLQLNAVPLFAAALATLFVTIKGGGLEQPRVAYFLSFIDPRTLLARLDLMATAFAKAALDKYAADEARQIVVYGLALALLAKFIVLNGPFALPLLFARGWSAIRRAYSTLQPFAWAWLVYLVLLLVYFVQKGFVNSRYVSLLNLLALPFLTSALLVFVQRFPRLGKGLVVVACLVMLHNVTSFGARKTHYLEAAAWLTQHTAPADTIYYEDARIAYYAGRGYPIPLQAREEVLVQAPPEFRYFVLTSKREDANLSALLEQQHKRVLGRFANRKGDSVLIVGD